MPPKQLQCNQACFRENLFSNLRQFSFEMQNLWSVRSCNFLYYVIHASSIEFGFGDIFGYLAKRLIALTVSQSTDIFSSAKVHHRVRICCSIVTSDHRRRQHACSPQTWVIELVCIHLFTMDNSNGRNVRTRSKVKCFTVFGQCLYLAEIYILFRPFRVDKVRISWILWTL